MRGLRRAVATLCAIQVVDVMGVTVVVSALPQMLRDLSAGPEHAALIVPAYAVGFASLLLVAARVGDRHGHRKVLQVGLLAFGAASLVAAVSPDISVLIGARAVQGIAAAISVPNALALLTRLTADSAARDRALAAWNACGGAGGALGLVVGGILTTTVGWRVIFGGTAALALVLAIAVNRYVSASTPDAQPHGSLPIASVVFQVVAVASVVLAAARAEHSLSASMPFIAAAIVAAALLFAAERRSREPLVPIRLWLRPGFTGGIVGAFGLTATTSAFVIVTTLYLQSEQQLTGAQAGLLILPFSLAAVTAASFAGRIIGRITPRTVLLSGLVLIGAAIAVPVVFPGLPGIVIGGIGAGVGNGSAAVAAYALATAVPSEFHGAAAGLLNTAAQAGTAILVAVAVAVGSLGSGHNHQAGWVAASATAIIVIIAILAVTPSRAPSARAR